MRTEHIDFYIQAILMAIAFYITIFTMMNIRPRWKWLVLPSFIIWVASDMWIAYMHVHNIDAQKIQTIKTIFMIQAILMFLMIFEASLWKIMTAIMMCDFVCGLPFVIVTGSEIQESGRIVLKIAPDLPYLPYGVGISFLLFLLTYKLLKKQQSVRKSRLIFR